MVDESGQGWNVRAEGGVEDFLKPAAEDGIMGRGRLERDGQDAFCRRGRVPVSRDDAPIENQSAILE